LKYPIANLKHLINPEEEKEKDKGNHNVIKHIRRIKIILNAFIIIIVVVVVFPAVNLLLF